MTTQKTSKPAIYVGRFNPIHVGHIRIIDEMLATHGPDNSLLVLGSSNADFSLRHFFSYHERKGFIQKLFPEIRIVGLPDYGNDQEWLAALDDLIRVAGMDPQDVTFFGGCQEDIRFFFDDGRNCFIMNRFDPDGAKTSATEVRDSLILGRSLDAMLPPQLIDDVKQLFAQKWEKFKKI